MSDVGRLADKIDSTISVGKAYRISHISDKYMQTISNQCIIYIKSFTANEAACEMGSGKIGRRKKSSNTKKAEEKWAVRKMGSKIGFLKSNVRGG